MDFSLLSRLKNSQSQWISPLLYLSLTLLVVTSLCYSIFAFKVYLQNNEISVLNSKLALYGSPSEKQVETKFLEYKKKIDSFNSIIGGHRTTSGAFNFLEDNTLPNVWYSSISILETKSEISLTGEASTMEVLSHQIQLFEQSTDQVKNVNVLSSKMSEQGRAQFSLTLSINPKLFLAQLPVASTTSP
jgi:hypothetical protein